MQSLIPCRAKRSPTASAAVPERAEEGGGNTRGDLGSATQPGPAVRGGGHASHALMASLRARGRRPSACAPRDFPTHPVAPKLEFASTSGSVSRFTSGHKSRGTVPTCLLLGTPRGDPLPARPATHLRGAPPAAWGRTPSRVSRTGTPGASHPAPLTTRFPPAHRRHRHRISDPTSAHRCDAAQQLSRQSPELRRT